MALNNHPHIYTLYQVATYWLYHLLKGLLGVVDPNIWKPLDHRKMPFFAEDFTNWHCQTHKIETKSNEDVEMKTPNQDVEKFRNWNCDPPKKKKKSPSIDWIFESFAMLMDPASCKITKLISCWAFTTGLAIWALGFRVSIGIKTRESWLISTLKAKQIDDLQFYSQSYYK